MKVEINQISGREYCNGHPELRDVCPMIFKELMEDSEYVVRILTVNGKLCSVEFGYESDSNWQIPKPVVA